METNKKLNLLDCVAAIHKQMENSKLEPEALQPIKNELQYLSTYLQVSESQTLLFSFIMSSIINGESVNRDKIVHYTQLQPVLIFKYAPDFEALEKKGYIIKGMVKKRSFSKINSEEYNVNDKLCNAIVNNENLPVLESKKITNALEWLEHVTDHIDGIESEELSLLDVMLYVNQMEYNYQFIPLVKSLYEMKLETYDCLIYIKLIWKAINGKQRTNLNTVLESIIQSSAKLLQYAMSINENDNKLIQDDLIGIEKQNFFNDSNLFLTEKSLEMLESFGIKIFLDKRLKNKNIIVPENILYRKLIFDSHEMSQLTMLQQLLSNDKLTEVQQKLTHKNLPKGITVLLHGYPGTGKTESVFQIAKQTNRAVMKVEISETKSMWFGESQKLVKKIFTDYYDLKKQEKICPILLFNEADAVIGKRKTIIAQSSSSHTENAIQNILLEELENFEGILMATSNLVANIDSAFDRRFLFKVAFNKPSEIVKTKIWQSKLPHLTQAECQYLSEEFDFSGGQIDNVTRKYEIQNIVNSSLCQFNDIVLFCQAEIFRGN